jgi:beta-lactamase superfamily II metal-dependent hydrolase
LLALILTHPDADHYNLVQEMLVNNNIPIANLYYGGQSHQYGNLKPWLEHMKTNGFLRPLGNPHFDPNPCATLSGAGMDVRIVAANVGDARRKTASNLNSVVVFVRCRVNTSPSRFTTFLLMGDSFVQTENWIM